MTLPTVVNSTKLEDYFLSKKAIAPLTQFSRVVEYARLSGQRPPSTIILYRGDYADIDATVRAQSEGKHSLETVTWAGAKLKALGE